MSPQCFMLVTAPKHDKRFGCDVSRKGFRQFILASVEVDGVLQALDFFLGAFREQGELTGVTGNTSRRRAASARDIRSNCSID